MKDPFETLGVSRYTSDDDIKSAYRKLVQKYHPDNYSSSPLEDLAQEKMSEINQAYDEVVRIRKEEAARSKSSSQGQYYTNYNNNNNSYSQNSSFSDVRRLINSNRIYEADELLNGVPLVSRDAEWNFLKGTISYSKGYLDDAYKFFQTAVNMNPSSAEYAAAFNRLKNQSGTNNFYNTGYRKGNASSCGSCDVCTSLLLADCCCECMGGDLIACC